MKILLLLILWVVFMWAIWPLNLTHYFVACASIFGFLVIGLSETEPTSKEKK